MCNQQEIDMYVYRHPAKTVHLLNQRLILMGRQQYLEPAFAERVASNECVAYSISNLKVS